MKLSCCCLRFFLLLGGSSGTAYDPSAYSEIAIARLPFRSASGAGVAGIRSTIWRPMGEGTKELVADARPTGGKRKGVRWTDGPAVLLGPESEPCTIARDDGKVVSLASCPSMSASASGSGRGGAGTHCEAIGTSSVTFVARLATAARLTQIYHQPIWCRHTHITHLVAIRL